MIHGESSTVSSPHEPSIDRLTLYRGTGFSLIVEASMGQITIGALAKEARSTFRRFATTNEKG